MTADLKTISPVIALVCFIGTFACEPPKPARPALPRFITIDGTSVPANAKMVDLTGRNIHDISGIAELKNVEWLRLGANPIDDITELGELTTLKQLELAALNPRDWTPIGKLHNLEKLEIINSARIPDTNFLTKLTRLTRIDFSCTPVTKLKAGELSGLTWLNIAYTGIETFEGFPPHAKIGVVLTPGVNQAKIDVYKKINPKAILGFSAPYKCGDWKPVYAPNARPQ